MLHFTNTLKAPSLLYIPPGAQPRAGGGSGAAARAADSNGQQREKQNECVT